MRIIIEDTQTPAQAPASHSMEGGAPAGQLYEQLGGGSAGQPAGQAEGLQDAGPPPGWLVEAVRQAFEQDPGRFETGSSSQGVGGDGGSAADGGSAPQASERGGGSK